MMMVESMLDLNGVEGTPVVHWNSYRYICEVIRDVRKYNKESDG